MDNYNDICLNCFKSKNGFEVCPHCGYVAAPPEQEYYLYPGTVLSDRYLIGTVIGFGGFGVTYKAWDLQMRSIVAIKEFYPVGLVNRVPGESDILIFDGTEKTNYKEALERFIEEATNLAKFNGKANIVNVFGYFEENNTAYIVMEYLDGISLKAYIEQNGKIPYDTAKVIIADLLEGTSEVHKAGILHRDIAPDNIVLTNEGNVKILDFGSARFAAEHSEKTLSAFIKSGYAAPEQYAAQGKQGPWTDIYGLGATMYYMVTGVKLDESTDRMVKDTAARPSDLGIDLPIEADKAIMKAIALQPSMRFKSTDEFLAALSGEYKIEYPDVEIHKRKIRRAIIAAASALTVIAAIAVTIFLYNYMQVDVYETIESGTELTVWVYTDNQEYDPGKSYMADSFKEKVVENKEAQYETQKSSYNSMINNFVESMETAYGIDVSVNILVFDNREGYDASLKEAAENGTLPDIFMVSDVYEDVEDYCMDLTDYSSVFTKNSFKFISESNYEELYPGKKLIPLGFSAPVLYVNTSLVYDYEIDDDADKNPFTAYSDIKALDQYADKETTTVYSKGKTVKTRTFGIDDSAYSDFIALYGSPLADDENNITIDDSSKSLIEDTRESYVVNKFNSEANVSDYFYYGQLAYLAGDISIFESVNNYMGGSFEIRPLKNDGTTVVNLEDEIALNADLDDNSALLAKAFIEYLLSDYGQSYLNIIIGNALPIYKDNLNEYISLNDNFDIFKSDYDNALVIGEKGMTADKIGSQLYNNCYKNDETVKENSRLKEETESSETEASAAD